MNNRHYLNWIRKQPCAICSDDCSVQAHHLIGGGSRGVAFRETDFWAIPLCEAHHRELHQIGHESWEIQYGQTQFELVAITLKKAIFEGVLDVIPEAA